MNHDRHVLVNFPESAVRREVASSPPSSGDAREEQTHETTRFTSEDPHGPADTSPSDVLGYVDGFPITATSLCTQALAGTTVAQASILDYEGKETLMFIFSVRLLTISRHLYHPDEL